MPVHRRSRSVLPKPRTAYNHEVSPMTSSTLAVGSVSVQATLVAPHLPTSWIVIVPPTGLQPADRLLGQLACDLQQAGHATMLVDLGLPRHVPWYNAITPIRQGERRLCAATDWLRARPEWQGLPIHYVGVGDGAAIALRAAVSADIATIVAWNGSPWAARQQLRSVSSPTLFVLDSKRPLLRWLFNRMACRRLGALSELEIVSKEAGLLATRISEWTRDEHARSVTTLVKPSIATRFSRSVATGALVLSLSVPLASTNAATPDNASSHAPAVAASLPQRSTTDDHDPFSDGVKINAGAIGGDGKATAAQGHGKHQGKLPKRKHHRGYTYQGGNVQGDGIHNVGIQATGSQALVDMAGVKWFANTNITFSTSSSASAAMSEASFTHAVAASTLNGGTINSTLNDAFDGYNTLCVSFTGGPTPGTCQTGNATFTIYNKNGAATTECPSDVTSTDRQVVFPAQVMDDSTTMGNITVTRKVFVPDNDSFARWINTFTNTGTTPETFTAVIATNLGSDANTTIVSSSNADTTADLTDTWISTFQNFSGTTSSDPRLGHVMQGPSAAVGLSNIHFANGDDNPYWAYQLTLAPGETQSILNFAVIEPSKPAANAKAGFLAGLPPMSLQCMTPVELGQIANFAVKTDLVLTGSATPDPVDVGGQLTYTLNVSNTGTIQANTVTLTDTLPSNVNFVSASGAGWTCTQNNGLVVCSMTNLAAGSAIPLTIVVSPNAPGSLTNSATVAADIGDPNTGNNDTQITTNAALRADIALSLDATPNPVNAGTNLTYTINVTNNGPTDTGLVTVTHTLPSGVSFVGASGAGWTCSQTNGIVTCSAPNLPTGVAPSISVVVTPTAGGSLVASADIISAASDSNTANNTSTTTTTALAADLSVQFASTPGVISVGEKLAYTINVTNAGPSEATQLVVNHTLPAGVTFVSASGDGWTCALGNGVVTCTRASLATGAAPPIKVIVTPTVIATLSSTVNVTAHESDLLPANNSASATTAATKSRQFMPLMLTSQGLADLTIDEVTLSPATNSFTAGQPVTIKVKITNRGTVAANPFWVDVYLNPSSPPTAANQIWDTRCGLDPCYGIAWGVKESLAPGASITLVSTNIDASTSRWPGWFASGTTDLYVYADSLNAGVSTGAVPESNESNNRAEIHGLKVTGPNP